MVVLLKPHSCSCQELPIMRLTIRFILTHIIIWIGKWRMTCLNTNKWFQLSVLVWYPWTMNKPYNSITHHTDETVTMPRSFKSTHYFPFNWFLTAYTFGSCKITTYQVMHHSITKYRNHNHYWFTYQTSLTSLFRNTEIHHEP